MSNSKSDAKSVKKHEAAIEALSEKIKLYNEMAERVKLRALFSEKLAQLDQVEIDPAKDGEIDNYKVVLRHYNSDRYSFSNCFVIREFIVFLRERMTAKIEALDREILA